MKQKILGIMSLLLLSPLAMADEVPGVTVSYVAEGTADYVQAISAIGKIKFEVVDEVKHAVIEFKDASLSDEDLGATSEISKIAFGNVSKSDITVENPTAVAEVEHQLTVTAYPNPTADHVHVDGVAEGSTIRIFSNDGKLVIATKDTDINLSGQPSGIYILQVGKEVVKIIKATK